MTELWKDVPSYEGIYQVSNQGSVRSLDRLMVCSGSVKGRYTSFKKGRLLRPGRMPSGHVSVALGRHNSMCVHTLVLLAFVGAPPPHYECLHDNGIPNDNRLENLRWGTRAENSIDKTKHGLCLLTVEKVLAIKRCLQNPYHGLGRDLATKYGVSECSISAIKHGREYAHVIL